MAQNSHICKATGLTPAQCMLWTTRISDVLMQWVSGRSEEVWEEIHQCIDAVLQWNKELEQQGRNSSYQPGDQVWLLTRDHLYGTGRDAENSLLKILGHLRF